MRILVGGGERTERREFLVRIGDWDGSDSGAADSEEEFT